MDQKDRTQVLGTQVLGTQVLDTKDFGARLLIVRNGVRMLANNYDNLINEIKNTRNIVDKKAFMRGRVVNKIARYNLCYADKKQEPNYEQRQGRVIAFNDSPELQYVRQNMGKLFGNKYAGLFAELNYYYDKKCGIGFHGDTERSLVIGLRFGDPMDIQFQWFKNNNPVGGRYKCILNEGDLYVMSEKTTGNDWKHSSLLTLRHGAGALQYTTIKPKKKTDEKVANPKTIVVKPKKKTDEKVANPKTIVVKPKKIKLI